MKIPIATSMTITKTGEVLEQKDTLVNLEDVLTESNFNMFCLLFFGMDAKNLYQKCLEDNIQQQSLIEKEVIQNSESKNTEREVQLNEYEEQSQNP